MRPYVREVIGEGPQRAPRVMKFGGSSVTGADRIDSIVEVIRDRSRSRRVVVVVSAFADVTATLGRIASAAAQDGVVPDDFSQLRAYHYQAVDRMTASGPAIRATVERILSECETVLSGVASTRSCSAAELDTILSFGERLSSEIIAAGLIQRGVHAVPVDAGEMIVTDANHGDARADFDATSERVQAAMPREPAVPVVTGFIGATSTGVRTTLGREGSDYSAAILAVCLEADGVEIWTDVDGVMTADPRVVPEALPLRELSYEELFDLTSWGAKVVHPKTVGPLHGAGIPLEIKNTTSPSDPGTRIHVGATGATGGPLGVTRLDVAALRSPGHGTPSTGEAREQLETLMGEIEATGRDGAIITVVHRRGAVTDRAVDTIADSLREKGIFVAGISEGANHATVSLGVACEHADLAMNAVHRTVFSSRPEASANA